MTAQVFAVALVLMVSAAAGDNPTKRAIRMEPLNLDASSGFSIKKYEIETGIYYRWRIESDGLEEYKLVAPELFRESWIDQVVINNLEVKPLGLHAVEFDSEGIIDIWFIVLRPGEYSYRVEGLEQQGFSGVILVR